MLKFMLLRQILPSAAVLAMASFLYGQSAPLPAPLPPSPSSPRASSAPAAAQPEAATAQPLFEAPLMYKVDAANGRLEMTVNTSRILTMDQKVAQVHVNNPEILSPTALSPNQLQISAKRTGVTQVNLWGEDQKVRTIDVIVYGDVKELEMVLRATFPSATLKIVPVRDSVLITGFIDRPELSDRIVRIAEEYYPKVINNMTVGGVQQVLLHVKIMEVSRTKLRRFGFDFSQISGSSVFTSNPVGLLSNVVDSTPVVPSTPLAPTAPWSPIVSSGGGGTMSFAVVNGSNAFLGVLDALRQDNMAKIMAEPTLVTYSGRPARFSAGGSFYIVPQGLAAGQPIQVDYGTQLAFVPVVLGNGRIRLDVRPEVSQIDPSLSVQGYPGLLDRKAETGVELQSGQTLAIAGLVQSRTESANSGLPWVSELPYVGMLFRTVKEQTNEVELLILVTPELVEAMDANEVPLCGPGTQTTSPSDWELFMKGHLEVPKCCPENGAAGNDGSSNGRPAAPPDGMILSPGGEPVPVPQPTDSARKAGRNATASRTNATGAGGSASSGGYASRSNGDSASPATAGTNNPPGFIGPVGYDVVK